MSIEMTATLSCFDSVYVERCAILTHGVRWYYVYVNRNESYFVFMIMCMLGFALSLLLV